MHAVFQPLPSHIRVALGWNTSFPKDEEPHSRAGLIAWCGNIFALDSVCAPLFSLSVCNIWHQANPSPLAVLGGEGMGSFTCSTRGTLQIVALRGLQEGTYRPWGLTLTIVADLALSFFYVSKVLFHPVPV